MSQQTKPTKEICLFCNKTVYFNEKVSVDNVAYHINCFRCVKCKNKINPLSYGKVEGRFYCKTHFEEKKREIMLRINFTEGLLTTNNYSKIEKKSPRKNQEKDESQETTPVTSPRKEEVHGNVKEFAKKYETIKTEQQKEIIRPKISIKNEKNTHVDKDVNPFLSPREETTPRVEEKSITPRVEDNKTPREDKVPTPREEKVPTPREEEKVPTPRKEEILHEPKKEETHDIHVPKKEDVLSPRNEEKVEEPRVLTPRNEEKVASPRKEDHVKQEILSPRKEELIIDEESKIPTPRKEEKVSTPRKEDHENVSPKKHVEENQAPIEEHIEDKHPTPRQDTEENQPKEEILSPRKDENNNENVDVDENNQVENIHDVDHDEESKLYVEREEEINKRKSDDNVEVVVPETLEKIEKHENESLDVLKDVIKREKKSETPQPTKSIRKSIGEIENLSKSFSEKILGQRRKSMTKKSGDVWVDLKLDSDEEYKQDFGHDRGTAEKLGDKKKEKKDKKKDKVEEEEEEKKPSKFNLFGLIKGVVSKNKKRFQEDGFDLDLSYINDNIIAMGFPSQGLEATYRNSMYDVISFLEKKHKDRYMVYNLCSEKLYDSESFKGRVDNFGFDDHNPPPLIIMRPLCNNIQTWLNGDNKRVAVVHCKAGKGRTGTIIAAYLLHVGLCKTADEALDLFSRKRTKDNKGVTIPSQIRYVHYYEKCLKKGFPRKDIPLIITQIKWNQAPFGPTSPNLKITQMGKELFNLKEKADIPTFEPDDLQVPIIFNFRCEVKSDFKVSFSQGDDKLFHFWLNTNMIEGDKQLLVRSDLDGGVKKDKGFKKYPSDFAVIIKFEKKQ